MILALLLAMNILMPPSNGKDNLSVVSDKDKIVILNNKLKDGAKDLEKSGIYYELYTLYSKSGNHSLGGEFLFRTYVGVEDTISYLEGLKNKKEFGDFIEQLKKQRDVSIMLLNCERVAVDKTFGHNKFKPVVLRGGDDLLFFVSDFCANVCSGKIKTTKDLGYVDNVNKAEIECVDGKKQVWYFDVKEKGDSL